jgi:PAS domain S-box-containing protein
VSPLGLPLPFLGLGSETQLRALADALPHGLFTIDVAGTITFWSQGAERITGYTRDEALGKPCSLLAGDLHNGCGGGQGPVHCGLVERGRSSKACTIRTKDGRALRTIKNAVPLLGEGGVPVGALETFAEAEGLVALESGPRGPGAPDVPGDFCGMTGRHADMRELYRTIELVARSDATVMIVGESGTGKDLVAQAIHATGPRAARPFVRVSCTALSDGLHSELFAAGASGSDADRRSRFEEADGGTLLLDEVGDLSSLEQAKLLRVIEQRAVERAGQSRPIRVDVRVLCATHRDLRQLVAQGRFRADLYFRLAVFPLRVPALRDRVEDVPLLAAAFLARHGALARLSDGAIAELRGRPWPGNVRELQNVLEYAALRAGAGGEIRPEHLPNEPGAGRATRDERNETLDALHRSSWNRTRAAAALGISRVTLWKRMRRHGLAEQADPE